MTKFDIFDSTEAATSVSAPEASGHSVLSADEILEYCASQLNGRDHGIEQSMVEMKEHLDHGSSSDAELDMLKLQSLMSERQQAVQLTTQIMQSLDDSEKSIVNNIDGGGGNGNKGDGHVRFGDGSSGDHPPGWPFGSTVSDIYHAGSGAAGDTNSSAEMDMLKLQDLMSERQKALQLTTEIMQNINDAEKSIVNNIGGGDGHASSGDGSASSGGDHPPGWPFTSTASDMNHAGVASHAGAETGSLPDHMVKVTLPDQAAPGLNEFLNGHGIDPSHPGTHLSAAAVDAGTGSASLVAASDADHSFGGQSAAFWHAAAQSQHVTAGTTAAAPVADASVPHASAPVGHDDSLGIFEHPATTWFAASAPVVDSHANMDALTTTHFEHSYVATEPSHNLGVGLDLGHLAFHI